MHYLFRAAVGLILGLLVGWLLIIFITAANDAETSLASLGGPLWLSVAALLIGVCYTLLYEPLRSNHLENIATGIVLGLILWVVWAISLHPFLLGRGHSWAAAQAAEAIPKLISYLIQGGLIGLLYGLVFQYLGRPLRLYRSTSAEPPIIKKRIVIVGGGYAGVTAAQTLEKELANDPTVGIYLVSKNNYLIHTPMLSEVSSSAVNAQNISPPLRSFFKKVKIIQTEIESINLNQKVVVSRVRSASGNKIPFDHLILAVGSVPNFFGNERIAKHAISFKSLQDAIFLRNQIIEMFERADQELDPVKKREMLTFVVAGGGFAGVELLGGINDFARGISFYYPNVDPTDVRTVLVHSRDRILPELSAELGQFAREKLTERGVEFKLGVRVTGAKPGAVEIGDEQIATQTFVWTAGNRPDPVLATMGIPLNKRGQVIANEKLEVTGAENLWAVGDCAQIPDLSAGPESGKFAPPTAQHATREGKVAGYNVAATLKGKPLKTFNFKSLGSLAALGHQLAVAEVFGRRFYGFFAWLLWRGIYLTKLPTLQKQIRVLLDWVLDIFFPPDIVKTIDLHPVDLDETVQEVK